METRQFVTNVGLITSNGPYGHNVMACEWTHHISYTPFLILVCIGPNKATFTNIKESKEFGVNIAASDQNSVASIVGNNSGKTVDKIKVLEELGLIFYGASKIDTLMIEGAAMNAECKLIKFVEIGDHPLFIGEALTMVEVEKKPLIYHDGKYWMHGDQIKKPDEEVLAQFADVIRKFKKGNK
ncbi:flavin reductase family protein [Candidatus Woesebacteria bacterium]|nr:flavin reductase family protein [Candidatus Woesebacteria bacterium]